jgi:hypothetical protein
MAAIKPEVFISPLLDKNSTKFQRLCPGSNDQYAKNAMVEHCDNFTTIRNKYYETTTLSELFSKVSPHKILEFLKECDLNPKI